MIPFRPAFALLIAALVAGAAANAAPPAAAPAKLARLDAQAAGFSSYLLPNGFKIILAPFASAANARVELLVKTGSKLEGYGETGMAHLLEHMLFKSAGSRADLKSDLTALGASWNGTTNADRTNYFETVAAEPAKIDEAIRIEADRFIRASFTRADLASEMSVVRNELERNDNDPGSLVIRALQRQSYFWHGYSRPTIGSRSDIEQAPFSALQAFHRKHYRPDNAALIVSGNFDAQRVLTLASRLFAQARNPASPKIASWTREETRASTNRSELFLPAGKTLAASAWKLPGIGERQTYAFDLAASAICDEDWGSLRKELVLERKIAVAVSCGTRIQSDYSLLIAYATAGQAADAEALSRALLEHIESAAARGVSQQQLDRARLAELNAYERLENAHEMLASQLSQAEAAGDWRLYFWQRDMVSAVDLAEANDALRKWAVGVNRSDVLLRHADGVSAPEQPAVTAPGALVSGKDWPVIATLADPLPNSAGELASATVTLALDGSRARAALISRQTQGGLAWLNLFNDYGNESALAGRQAACGFADPLMAYGGAGLDRDQLAARLDALQAKWSLGLGGIVIEAPRRNIDAALDLLLGVWAAPALPESEFDRLKAAAIARLEAALKDPAQVAANEASLRFDNYPAGHPLAPRSLAQQLAESRAASFAQASACVADFSGLAQLRLALVGAFSPQDVEAVWQRVARLPTAKIAYERVRDVAAPIAVETAPIIVSMPEKPNASVFGSTLLRITDDSADFPALRIAVKVLGGDADSRIWTRLREREGLAYSAGASLAGNSFDPRSRLLIHASAASGKADAALASLQQELARALKDGFSAAEVERAKRAWLQERKTSLRDERSYASSLAQGLYSGRDYSWLARYDERIGRLSASEVTQALRKYLSDAPLVWAIGRGD
jgi:zinc protease